MRTDQSGDVPAAGPEPRGLLLERERELATLREAVADATEGGPGLLVIEGPAGIGKTRLLAEGRRVAEDSGALVLLARGGELERELAFGIVRQLFEQEVIAREAKPLRGAADGAREVFDATVETTDGDVRDDASFAILHALYWMTVNVAADAPLVVAVDDLHWCDVPSLRYLGCLVRRLEGLSVTVMCTVRPLAGRAQAALLGEIVGDPLSVSLHPRPLSDEATARLVGKGLEDGADEEFSKACHTATGGNPLLLGELIKMLDVEGVQPDAAHVSAVTDLGPSAVSRAVLVRLGRLSSEAARLARAAAVLGDGAELPLVAEAAGLAPDQAGAAVSALVGAEILSDHAGIAFVRPLVGAAVYEDIPAHERSVAHERAARLLRERDAPAGELAVHLALAPARGEQWVCDSLEQAAHASLRAGAPESAVRYLTRALAEPPLEQRREQVLLDLGRAEALVNGPAAVEHLTEALELTDELAAGSVALALARALLFTGQAEECVTLIRRTAAELGPDSDDLARALEALELMVPLFGAGETVSPERLEHLRELPRDAGVGAKMLATVTARHWAYAGGSADACAELALDSLEGGELVAADNVFMSVTAILILVLADRPEEDEAWEDLLRDARFRGSLVSKASISLWRGYALYRRGELDDAESSLRAAREALTLWNAGAEGRGHLAAFLSASLRERGDLGAARLALEDVEDPGDASDAARYWLNSLAELLIAEERYDEALAVADDSERRFAFLAHPIDTPMRSHRAVALYHVGRREEALALAAESLDLARRWGAPATVARALRILGTLERDAGLERLHEAVEVAEGSPAQLELAKALAALGSAQRVARRPTDARAPLRRALELADALGAEGLVTYARQELHAAGGRPRTKALTGPAALTPSERRVTERAAAGQTNREIAEALFVTAKTVELHLRNAYRKLGVSSRRELPDELEPPS